MTPDDEPCVVTPSEHRCFITDGAGGLIDPAWCSSAFEPVMRALPRDLTEDDVTREELLLYRDPVLEVFFCPFDYLNRHARVVLVGLTPGRSQAHLALATTTAALAAGASLDDALAAADAAGSFAGSMRTNLVRMLDGIGLHDALGLDGCGALFDERTELVASTSAVCHPVFVRGGQNYGGTSPTLDRHPLLRAFAEQVLAANLAALPDALVVPLGKAASLGVALSGIDPARVLDGFPHPSGGNGHRVRLYEQHRARLTTAVRAWT